MIILNSDVSPISVCPLPSRSCQSRFSVHYMLQSVSPGFPSVTCNGRRIGTDRLTIRHTHRHATLYSRIFYIFYSAITILQLQQVHQFTSIERIKKSLHDSLNQCAIFFENVHLISQRHCTSLPLLPDFKTVFEHKFCARFEVDNRLTWMPIQTRQRLNNQRCLSVCQLVSQLVSDQNLKKS